MEKTAKKFTSVDEYISGTTGPGQVQLTALRKTIKKIVPSAEEVISYNMPAFTLNGILVWYAAYKNHIGFYPRPSGIAAFKKELSGYVFAKGSVRFPIDQPLPIKVIGNIVKYRVAENEKKQKATPAKKKARSD